MMCFGTSGVMRHQDLRPGATVTSTGVSGQMCALNWDDVSMLTEVTEEVQTFMTFWVDDR